MLAFGIEDRLAEFEGERRDLAATAGVDHRAGRRRVPRPSVLDRRQPRGRSSCPTPSRESRSSTRAASSSSAEDSPPFTGTCCWTRVGCATRSPATTATTRASTPTSPGPGSGPSRPSRACSTRSAPAASTARRGRASRPSSRVEAPSRCSAIRAARSGSSSGSRVGQPSTRAGLGYRYGGEILATNTDGLVTAARLDLPESAPYARVEVADVRGGRAWTNPL